MHRQNELPPRTLCVCSAPRALSLRWIPFRFLVSSCATIRRWFNYPTIEWSNFIDRRWCTNFRKCPFNHFAHACTRTIPFSGIARFISINFAADRKIALEKCWQKPRRYRQSNFAGSQSTVGVKTSHRMCKIYRHICCHRWQCLSHLPSYGFCAFCARYHRTPRTAANELKLYRFHNTHTVRERPDQKPSGSRYCLTENLSGIPSQPIYTTWIFSPRIFHRAHEVKKKLPRNLKFADVVVGWNDNTLPTIFHWRKLIKPISGSLCAPVSHTMFEVPSTRNATDAGICFYRSTIMCVFVRSSVAS